MRFAIALASLATLALCAPAQAEFWCGFHDKTGAIIKCGFSSAKQCHDMLGRKDTLCVPDPEFASSMEGSRRWPGHLTADRRCGTLLPHRSYTCRSRS